MWSALHSAFFVGRDKVVIADVGANKGYVFAELLDIFRPDLGIHPGVLGPLLERNGVTWPCGVCRDCKERGPQLVPFDAAAPLMNLELHAFEPVEGNQAALDGGIVSLLAQHENSRVEFVLHRVAVVGDARVSHVDFGVCVAGEEGCGLGTASLGMRSVNATTLDAWAVVAAISLVDILVIDAEGFEPLVLAGARGLLSSSVRVRLFVFEYSGMWVNETLANVVDDYDALGYSCFLLQQALVVRLTGCWVPEMEGRYWSNVMCVLRSEGDLHDAVSAFTPIALERSPTRSLLGT